MRRPLSLKRRKPCLLLRGNRPPGGLFQAAFEEGQKLSVFMKSSDPHLVVTGGVQNPVNGEWGIEAPVAGGSILASIAEGNGSMGVRVFSIGEAAEPIPVVTFKAAEGAPEGRPSPPYMMIVREAAWQRGLPEEYIAFLDRVETAA